MTREEIIEKVMARHREATEIKTKKRKLKRVENVKKRGYKLFEIRMKDGSVETRWARPIEIEGIKLACYIQEWGNPCVFELTTGAVVAFGNRGGTIKSVIQEAAERIRQIRTASPPFLLSYDPLNSEHLSPE